MDRRKVVITGMGTVSPLGCELDTVWDALVAGTSGVSTITSLPGLEDYDSQIAGQVQGFDGESFFAKKELRKMDPFVRYGLAAAMMALRDSGLEMDREDPRRMGVIASSGVGGLQELEAQYRTYMEKGPRRYSPFMIPKMITNIIAGEIAIRLGFKGPNFCVTSACASGTHSLGEAMRKIQYGEADVVLSGGTEAPICTLGVGGFCAMKALSTRNDEPERASRPFDAERDGFVVGEGAGMLVLEEYERAKARGARIYCEIAGYGASCDAYHITAPNAEGEEAARAMEIAVRDAGLTPDGIDYINAHGTSTPLNDKTETLAVKKAFGEEAARKVMISSTKSMTGHLLGAAGGMEAIAVAKSLQTGVVHPTINYENPDPECDLDYVPNEAREKKIRAALSNSLGFGGHNGTLAFRAV
ncbi:beta-ketoacyl-ACP synthase II [Kiritimatiella glycovorans]|uniref:3-oxoacyl-[acyl-carrier-protein] synthase 2 n=1 Tax=Kiritimatiella glycovorans TaxID=1307763 RepID=A0A0G3EB56_9BACT|nr:beta-ketoacyl-ACP synthase II [Kiritimatiella glycovorans]AKJ63523.1 3-oxoacyl-[acyl-carrier-protein] synthase 2 [Kiritimatiella glycovorans]